MTTTHANDLHARLQELTDRSLSHAARYGHVGVLLAASGIAVLVAALLLTEPGLPPRTMLAFGGLLVVAACWIGYSGWVLSRRRPLFQRHRVVAGTMATVFSGAFTLAATGAALVTGSTLAWTAALMGAGMLVFAALLLARARRRHDALVARRDELLRERAGTERSE